MSRKLQDSFTGPLRDASGKLVVPPSTGSSNNLFFRWEDDGEPVLICEVPIAQRALRLERILPHNAFADWGPMVFLCDYVISSHRQLLRSGKRVVELGCGIGLPSMVCAALGARVLATDLPQALEDMELNGAANAWPQKIWKVVGGGTEGVPVSKERGGKIEKEKLSQGALVEELELKRDMNVMRYRRMTGTGPTEGWVQLLRPSGIKPLLVKTELRPPAQKAKGTLGHGSLIVTGLRWDENDALSLMRRVDELEAAAESLQPVGPEVPAKRSDSFIMLPGQILRPDGFPKLADLVLCADVVCEPAYGESWEQLVEVIEKILAPEGHAVIALRRRSYDGVEKFIMRLARKLRFQRYRCRKGDNGVDLICAAWPSKAEQFEQSVDSPRNPRDSMYAAFGALEAA
ncbi:unnamed protein product [Effrenium voratum]|uniref:Uncharacterized protein n=1 Tax=Effrenium voratum TaxID=2562239 RepID=A0AA36I6C8_9DINO|nr:unnamed protein product [Effrenium voratum]CAJ1443020.1 unnamed protein product [Effrenium voratum]